MFILGGYFKRVKSRFHCVCGKGMAEFVCILCEAYEKNLISTERLAMSAKRKYFSDHHPTMPDFIINCVEDKLTLGQCVHNFLYRKVIFN
jgi:hypothetical protein